MIDLGASLLEPLACGCHVSRTGLTGSLSILWLFDHVRIASRGTQTSVTKLILRIVSTSWLLRDLTAAGLPGYQPKIFILSSLEMRMVERERLNTRSGWPDITSLEGYLGAHKRTNLRGLSF